MKEEYLVLEDTNKRKVFKIDYLIDSRYPLQLDFCHERRSMYQFTIKEVDMMIRALVEFRMDWEREDAERKT